MKKLTILYLLLLTVQVTFAQIEHPVKWSYAAKRTGKNAATVFLKATMEPGWHIYSAYQADGGPVKTSFSFSASNDFALLGQIVEPPPVVRYEEAFHMKVAYFENNVIFQQKLRLKAAKPVVKGSLSFMVCNDRKCLAPETVPFTIPVN